MSEAIEKAHERLADQIVAQKEAFIKRAVANELGDEPPGLTDLRGRLHCYSMPDGVERWTLDNKHILTLWPPQYQTRGSIAIRATVQGKILNEPEPEALPEQGETLILPSQEGK